MMRTIDVDEGALLQAKHTADRAQSHAYREIGMLNDRIGRASAASNAARILFCFIKVTFLSSVSVRAASPDRACGQMTVPLESAYSDRCRTYRISRL